MKSLTSHVQEALSGHKHVLIFGDSQKAVRELPTVNLAVTSPPYDDRRMNTYGGVAGDKYVDWMMPILSDVKSVLAADGSLVLNLRPGRTKTGAYHIYDCELKQRLQSSGLFLFENIQWYKCNYENFLNKQTMMGGQGTGKYGHRSCTEPIWIFSQNADYQKHVGEISHPTGDWAKARQTGRFGRVNAANDSGFGCDRRKAAANPFARHTDVLFCPTVTSYQQTYGHSAVFPVAIPQHFIKYLTSKNEVVLDPFVGSGSTIEAAHKEGRLAIGIDNCEASIASAERRLKTIGASYLRLNVT